MFLNVGYYCIMLIVEYRMLPNDSTNSSSDVVEEDAISVSYSTREAWNEYFYTLHSLRLCCPVHTFEILMQPQGNGKFSISCVGACVCVCVEVVQTRVCLNVLSLTFALLV